LGCWQKEKSPGGSLKAVLSLHYRCRVVLAKKRDWNMLFEMLTISVLHYRCEVWEPNTSKNRKSQLERIQKQMMATFLRVKKQHSK